MMIDWLWKKLQNKTHWLHAQDDIIDLITDWLMQTIDALAKRYLRQKRSMAKFRKPWVNKQALALIKDTKIKYCRWRRHPTDENLTNYKQTWNKKQTFLKQRKKKYMENLLSGLQQECSTTWWDTVRILRKMQQVPRQRVPTIKLCKRDGSEVFVTDDAQKAELLNQFYCAYKPTLDYQTQIERTHRHWNDDYEITLDEVIKGDIDWKTIDQDAVKQTLSMARSISGRHLPNINPLWYYQPPNDNKNTRLPLHSNLRDHPTRHQEELENLTKPVTVHELNYMVRQCKTGVYVGGGRPFKLFRASLRENKPFWLWYSSKVISTGHFPSLCKRRYGVGVCKPRRNPHQLKSYRPIVASGLLTIIIDRLIDNRFWGYVYNISNFIFVSLIMATLCLVN